MISVDEALDHLFALARPLGTEHVPLSEAAGRVLSAPVSARRTQPPFAASAMDGYALRSSDAVDGATLDLVGEAAAGHGYAGTVGQGQCVRIFTGAPLPDGADHVTIQENVSADGSRVTLTEAGAHGAHIRPAGADFSAGESPLTPPKRLTPSDIALLAAMNVASVPVTRQARVALIATGDELVMPGEAPGPDQIIASNTFGLQAMLREAGALPRVLPIARDTLDSLASAFRFARDADLIVTIGGASVGDHDLVAQAAAAAGMKQSFYKIAMRPGKPLMAGAMSGRMMIGLPGNPVSAMVCGRVFVGPVIDVLHGLPARPAPRITATLTHDMPEGGPREHYMRAVVDEGQVTVASRQDSALLSVLAAANALAIRPIGAPPAKAGDPIEILPL